MNWLLFAGAVLPAVLVTLFAAHPGQMSAQEVACTIPLATNIGPSRSILKTKAGILVGSEKGLFLVARDGARATPVIGNASFGEVTAISETKTGVLVGTDDDLFLVTPDGRKAATIPRGNALGDILTIAETKAGIFVGAMHGVLLLDPEGTKVTIVSPKNYGWHVLRYRSRPISRRSR